MTKTFRWILVMAMAIAPAAWVSATSLTAHAQTPAAAGQCDNCGPVQNGSNTSRSTQSGTSKSGDAVGGQVTGVVSSGAASVDARNSTTDSSATSGDATGTNTQEVFAGNVRSGGGDVELADATGRCDNCGPIQDGSNRSSANQSANAITGDGVAGQVTGVVTAAGGSASVVAANTTLRSDALTGDATTTQDQDAFAGLVRTGGGDFTLTDANGRCDNCGPIQDGTNTTNITQTANATTGDAVAGQVNGVVAGGRTSLDANNNTTDSSATSGDANANNDQDGFAGSIRSSGGEVGFNAEDAAGRCGSCGPIQDGNNRSTGSQNATATSGDAVAGEVSGVVTSAGGSASVVVANTTLRTDSLSGDSNFSNTGFVGTALARTGGGEFEIGGE